MIASGQARAPAGCLATWGSSLAGGRLWATLQARQARPGASSSRQRRASLRVVARSRQRRLLSYVLSAPQRVERHLQSSLWRQWMWAGIAFATGFYAGNVASLSFGALAINDVFAAVITLLFCEVITHLYYTQPAGQRSLRLWFANCFKMGLIASLLADAAKLGS